MTRRLTWPQRIAQAKRRGEFTDDDRRRVARWNQCAVGEVAPFALRRVSIDARYVWAPRPIFSELDTLGMDFAGAVAIDDFAGARSIYRQIVAQAKEDAKAPR